MRNCIFSIVSGVVGLLLINSADVYGMKKSPLTDRIGSLPRRYRYEPPIPSDQSFNFSTQFSIEPNENGDDNEICSFLWGDIFHNPKPENAAERADIFKRRFINCQQGITYQWNNCMKALNNLGTDINNASLIKSVTEEQKIFCSLVEKVINYMHGAFNCDNKEQRLVEEIEFAEGCLINTIKDVSNSCINWAIENKFSGAVGWVDIHRITINFYANRYLRALNFAIKFQEDPWLEAVVAYVQWLAELLNDDGLITKPALKELGNKFSTDTDNSEDE